MPSIKLPPEICRPCTDPKYRHPTPEEVASYLDQAGITTAQAGAIVGRHQRTASIWRTRRKIPYAAWRLLLAERGLA